MNRVVLMSAGALLVLSLPACDRLETLKPNRPAVAKRADTDAAKKLHIDAIAGLNAKNWAAVKTLYAPDAVMIIPDSPAFKGARAINAEYDRLATDPAVTFQGTPGAMQISSSGDLAYGDATYKMTFTNTVTKKVESGSGYCLWVFRKEPNGSWKIVRDISSPLPAEG